MSLAKSPWNRVVTADDIAAMYDSGKKYGGKPSAPLSGCIEQCLGDAWSAEGYIQGDDPNAQQGGLLFAVYLMWYLVQNHCYTDGNKRIGWFALVHVLRRLHLTVQATDDEAHSLTIAVADSKATVQDVIAWLQADRLISVN